MKAIIRSGFLALAIMAQAIPAGAADAAGAESGNVSACFSAFNNHGLC